MKLSLIIILVVLTSCATKPRKKQRGPASVAQAPLSEHIQSEYHHECQTIKKLLSSKHFKISCADNYQHFNTDFSDFYHPGKSLKRGKVRIGSFNMDAPGMQRTRYRDFEILAYTIDNQWDVVSALELVPLLGPDYAHNRTISGYIKSAHMKLSNIKTQLKELGRQIQSHIDKDLPYEQLEQQQINLRSQMRMALRSLKKSRQLYRMPGYLKILQELRQLDRSWSLILTPYGQSIQADGVEELTGFYYRARRVKPIVNYFCQRYQVKVDINQKAEEPYACMPHWDKKFFGENSEEIRTNLPFIGSFESGKFDFSLIAFHNRSEAGSAQSEKKLKGILQFADVLHSTFNEKDILLMGDFNASSHDQQLRPLIPPNFQLLINQPTVLTSARFHQDGKPTMGLSHDMDHFVVNKTTSHECTNRIGELTAKTVNFQRNNIGRYLNLKYLYRVPNLDKNESGEYVLKKNKDSYVNGVNNHYSINDQLNAYRKMLSQRQTVKDDKITNDIEGIDSMVEGFQTRVFLSQKNDQTFYQYVLEVFSDHLPISLSCRTDLKDDD